MKKITDEMLNDYIDNQLDSTALSELKKELADDEESLNKMKALKIVDETLRNLEVTEAPVNFPEKVMSLITKSTKSIKPKMNNFFAGIISIFGVIITGVLAAAWIIVEKQNPTSGKLQAVESAKKFVNENMDSLNKIFNSHQALFVGGLFAAILLLSAVVIVDSHKNFKNKLKSITQ